MPTWLVTGGSGFLGQHLLNRLRQVSGLESRLNIVAIGRRLPASWSSEAFLPADLNDPGSLSRAIAEIRPDLVFHLAGQTPPADGPTFHRANVGGTSQLLRALLELGRPCRVLTAGSAAELGPVPDDCLPIDEHTPCRPEGPYGLSKWFASHATLTSRGPVEGIVARIFNPIGPGMPAAQAFGRFARRLASATADGSSPLTLRTGNLNPRRDFIDARDVAEALLALALRGQPGHVYHVGTGLSHRIGDGLDHLIALSGHPVLVEADSTPSPGPQDSRACINRIREETGWFPRIPFHTSLADLWDSLRPDPPAPRSLRPDPPHADPSRADRPPMPPQAGALQPSRSAD